METVFDTLKLYISKDGNGHYSGLSPESGDSLIDGPLANLDQALEKIENYCSKCELNSTANPVTIYIREGIYNITKPFSFPMGIDKAIIIKPYRSENVVIDGSVSISGLEVKRKDGIREWILKVPQIANRNGLLHQLFINGTRRNKNRYPKDGYLTVKSVDGKHFKDMNLFEGSNYFEFCKEDFDSKLGIENSEILVPHYWTFERMPVEKVDFEKGVIFSKKQSIFSLRDGFKWAGAKYYFENVSGVLNESGQWYHDLQESKIHYIPFPDENLIDSIVSIPVSEKLIDIKGNIVKGKIFKDITFENITFRHTCMIAPENIWDTLPHKKLDSKVEYAAEPQSACNVIAAISLQGVEKFTMKNCKVHSTGGYAIDIGAGCADIRISDCKLYDLGAGGIKINGGYETQKPEYHTYNTTVANNQIYDGGKLYMNAAAILIMHSCKNIIMNNTIHDFFATGISCGWIWGYGENITNNNKIIKNHIYNLGKGILSDMGGIYLLGLQPQTIVSNNLIHDIEAANYGGWGIYPDEGSGYLVIENNVVYNTSHHAFNQHFGIENIVRNNIFAFSKEGLVQVGRRESKNQINFFKNIFISHGSPFFIGGYALSLEENNFLSDCNCFWDTADKTEDKKNEFKNLQSMGYEINSIFEDPHINGIEKIFKFRPSDNVSRRIGFKEIDLSDVGAV